MPAAPAGTVTSTLRDGAGTAIVVYTQRWDPATDLMLGVDVENTSGKPVTVLAHTPASGLRTFNIPVGTTTLTPAQLASEGITTHADMGGTSVTLT